MLDPRFKYIADVFDAHELRLKTLEQPYRDWLIGERGRQSKVAEQRYRDGCGEAWDKFQNELKRIEVMV